MEKGGNYSGDVWREVSNCGEFGFLVAGRSSEWVVITGGFMYRGASHLNLDEKGRITMPARYRSEILASCGGRLVITVDTAHCLMIYPFPQWERIEAALMAQPNVDRQVRRLQRTLIGNAHEVEMTAQGRILVAPSLREFAGLKKQVTLVGQGNKFELWDAECWKEQMEIWLAEEAELEGTSEALSSLLL